MLVTSNLCHSALKKPNALSRLVTSLSKYIPKVMHETAYAIGRFDAEVLFLILQCKTFVKSFTLDLHAKKHIFAREGQHALVCHSNWGLWLWDAMLLTMSANSHTYQTQSEIGSGTALATRSVRKKQAQGQPGTERRLWDWPLCVWVR